MRLQFTYVGETAPAALSVASDTPEERQRQLGHAASNGFDRAALDRLGLVRHGYGTIRYGSGNSYAGQWENDRRCGEGKFVYACGDVYQGQCASIPARWQTVAGTLLRSPHTHAQCLLHLASPRAAVLQVT